MERVVLFLFSEKSISRGMEGKGLSGPTTTGPDGFNQTTSCANPSDSESTALESRKLLKIGGALLTTRLSRRPPCE